MEGESRQRPIGFPSLLALGLNGVVGVGIFFAPAKVAAEVPGMAGVLVYVATAAALLPIAAGYAILGRRFGVDGGPYVWAEAAFGPSFGFVVGWITYTSSLFSMAAVVAALSRHAAPLFGITAPFSERLFGAALLMGLSFVAASGLRPSARVWTSITVLKLLPLGVLLLVGMVAFSRISVGAPLAGQGPSEGSLARAVLVVVFALQGFEIVPLLAGSVRRSETAVPLATVASLGIAAVLYAALHALAVHGVPDLGRSSAPLVDAARVYGGEGARALVAAGANISALGITFGMLNTAPRYLSTLSGAAAFGPWIGRMSDTLVPSRALWATSLVAAVLVLASEHVTGLFVLSSLAVLAQFAAALLSLAVLAYRRQQGLSRRDLWPVPVSAVGLVLSAMGAQKEEVLVALGVLALGLVLRGVARRGVSSTS